MLLTQAVTCPSAWGAVLQGCRVSRCDLFVERCKAQASGAGTLLPRPGSRSDAPWKGSVPLRAQGPWGRVVRPRWGLASLVPCESPCAQSPLSLRDQCFRLLATTIRVNRERSVRPLVPRAPESVPPSSFCDSVTWPPASEKATDESRCI